MCSKRDDLNVNSIDVGVRIDVGRVSCSDLSIQIGVIADSCIGDHSECTGLDIEFIEIPLSVENGSFGEETDGPSVEVCTDGVEQTELNIGFIISENTDDTGMGGDGGVVVHDDAIASGAIDSSVGGADLYGSFVVACSSVCSQIGVDTHIVFGEDRDVTSSGRGPVDCDDVRIDDDITGSSASFDEDSSG